MEPKDSLQNIGEEIKKKAGKIQQKQVCQNCGAPSTDICSNGHQTCAECLIYCRHCGISTCMACDDNLCYRCLPKKENLPHIELNRDVDPDLMSVKDFIIFYMELEMGHDQPDEEENLENVSIIRGANSRRAYFKVISTADKISEEELTPEIKGIIRTANEAVEKSNALIKDALELKKQGYLSRAREHLARALNMVTDHEGARSIGSECQALVKLAKEYAKEAERLLPIGEINKALWFATRAIQIDLDLLDNVSPVFDYIEAGQAKEYARKRALKLAKTVSIIAILVATSFTGWVLWKQLQIRGDDKAYQLLWDQMASEKDPNRLENILKNYLKVHPDSRYINEVKRQLNAIPDLQETLYYQRIISDETNFGDEYEKLRPKYDDFLKKYPKGKFSKEINKKLNNLPNLMAARDYKAIKTTKANLKLEDKIILYKNLLSEYPDFPESKQARRELKDLTDILDHKDYQMTMERYNILGDNTKEQFKILNEYIKKHPNGKYIKEVTSKLGTIPYKILQEILDELNQLLTNQQWELCLKKSNEVLSMHKGLDPKSIQKIKQIIDTCSSNIRAQDWKKTISKVKREYNIITKQKLLNNFIKKFPETKEAKEAFMTLSLLEKEYWDNIINKIRNQGIPIIQKQKELSNYIKFFTNGSHKKEALKTIIDLQKEYFLKNGWWDEPSTGYIITTQGTTYRGTIREDGGFIKIALEKSGTTLSLQKRNIKYIGLSDRTKLGALYNKHFQKVNINNINDMVAFANWCHTNKLQRKSEMIFVTAGYLFSNNSMIIRKIKSMGYVFRYGMWVKK